MSRHDVLPSLTFMKSNKEYNEKEIPAILRKIGDEEFKIASKKERTTENRAFDLERPDEGLRVENSIFREDIYGTNR